MPDLDDAALEILNGRHVATLATQGSDGRIHLTAVWYMYRDGVLYVPSNSKSRKVRNVETHSTASLLVDTRTPGFESGVTTSGTADVIRGAEALLLNRQIYERYLTEKALSDPEVIGFFATSDDVAIRLTPESWISWDVGEHNVQRWGGRLSTETGYLFPYDDATAGRTLPPPGPEGPQPTG